jgi:allantoinase
MKKVVDLIVTGVLYKGGSLLEETSLIIDGGKVLGIGRFPDLPNSKETIHLKGIWILPGAIDAHVHSLSNPNEGFFHATRAAAAGGVTTIIDHPLDFPQGIKSVDDLEKKIALIEGESFVDVALLGGLVDSNLDEVEPFWKAGVCGFKILMHETAPQRFSRMHDGHLLEAFEKIRATGLPAGVHAENDEVIKYRVDQWKRVGSLYPMAHCETRPPVTEIEAVHKALDFANHSRVHLHLFHLSLSQDFYLIDQYREKGLKVTSETCPHYLLLFEELMNRFKGYAKINPPLRPGAEAEALWKLLAMDKIDLVTSDHAPWFPEHKEHESIFDCSAGTPGVQTLLPLMLSEGVAKGRISLDQMVNLLSENPAKTFGLYPKKGNLLPGSDADVVLIDPKKRWRLRGDEMQSAAKWTLFEGMEIRGKVIMTIVGGKIVYRDGTFGENPIGKFVSPLCGKT